MLMINDYLNNDFSLCVAKAQQHRVHFQFPRGGDMIHMYGQIYVESPEPASHNSVAENVAASAHVTEKACRVVAVRSLTLERVSFPNSRLLSEMVTISQNTVKKSNRLEPFHPFHPFPINDQVKEHRNGPSGSKYNGWLHFDVAVPTPSYLAHTKSLRAFHILRRSLGQQSFRRPPVQQLLKTVPANSISAFRHG